MTCIVINWTECLGTCSTPDKATKNGVVRVVLWIGLRGRRN